MATLDTYREELAQWKAQGMSKAIMLRKLEQEYGVEIGKTTFYAYVENLGTGKALDANAEAVQALLVSLPEEIRELHATMNKILQVVQENDKEQSERWQNVQKALGNGNGQAIRAPLPLSFQTPTFRRARLPSIQVNKPTRIALIGGGIFIVWMMWTDPSWHWMWLQAKLFVWKWYDYFMLLSPTKTHV